MKSAVTEPESRAPSTSIRQDLCRGVGVHGRHKGWFSEFRTEQSQKIRQPVASLLETTPQKGPPRQEEAAARRHSHRGSRCLCRSRVRLQAAISGSWRCVTFAIFPPHPEKQTRRWPPPGGGGETDHRRSACAGAGWASRAWGQPRGATSACRCPAVPCSWGSSGPRPAGHPRRRG